MALRPRLLLPIPAVVALELCGAAEVWREGPLAQVLAHGGAVAQPVPLDLAAEVD